MALIAVALGLLALFAAAGRESGNGGAHFVTRRAFARLTLWGAVGLSFLPGCRRSTSVDGQGPSGAEPDYTAGSDPGLLAKWAELGRLWRELNSLATDEFLAGDDTNALERRHYALGEQLRAALDEVSASPELRALVEERSRHMRHYELGTLASCYEYMGPIAQDAGESVADQVNELRRLVEDGTLTQDAARKAAETLAQDAEYTGRLSEMWDDLLGNAGFSDELDKLRGVYSGGEIEPQPAAEVAGERLVELTVDKLGWLAGPVVEEEEADHE